MTSKLYRLGTHRAVAPDVTLGRVLPLLSRFGVTRIADITGLDYIGIPTYCAIRPASPHVQVSNGKGLHPVDAQVSAVMEAIELAHAEEYPSCAVRFASRIELESEGERVLPEYRLAGPPRGRNGKCEWVSGDDLINNTQLWLPASIAWIRPRQSYTCDWNGIASGNTLEEATLHGLYEILERHVLSTFVSEDQLDMSSADVLELASIDDSHVAEIVSRIASSGLRLVLIRANSDFQIHAFLAALLDPHPFADISHVNVGYGAHLSPSVAAARAITEAAQSRLTFIHGAREDLRKEAYQRSSQNNQLFQFFSKFVPDTQWTDLIDLSDDSLESDLNRVISSMRDSELGNVFRVDMSQPNTPFAVVKICVPGAQTKIVA